MADFTEKQVYEALGLGAQEQEPADPAEQPSEAEVTGAQEQEPADPAPADTAADTGETQSTADETQNDAEAAATVDDPRVPQTPEQRRENANRRRRQEMQAAINQAVQTALAREREQQNADLKNVFSKMNLKDTFTGEPITTMEQFKAWNQKYSEEKLARDLQAGKLTAEGLSQAIGNHPVVQQAQKLLRRDEAVRQAQQTAAERTRIDAEIAEIGKLDPTIRNVGDLLRMPNAKEFYALVQRGYSFKDAHYIVNREKIENAKIEAAKQQTMNSVRSKDHLEPGGSSRGGGAISVPSEELAVFRQFNPNATDAQIQAYYNKYHQK